MDREGRASDLLSRIEVSGLQTGVNAFDLCSKDVREVFRNFSGQLASTLQGALKGSGLCDEAQLEKAVAAVRGATATQRDAQMNRLDNALAALLQAADPGCPAKERVEVLEQLVACLQAARLAALHGGGQQQQQPDAKEGAASPSAAASGPAPAPAPAASAAVTGSAKPPAATVAGAAGAAAADSKLLAAHAGEVSRSLRMAAEALQVSMPAPATGGAAPSALPLVQQLLGRVTDAMAQLGPTFFQPICSRSELTEQELSTLTEVHAALTEEYALRRAVLVERAKVTLQAFEWSPRLAEKGTAAEATQVAAAARKTLAAEPKVSGASRGGAPRAICLDHTTQTSTYSHASSRLLHVWLKLLGLFPRPACPACPAPSGGAGGGRGDPAPQRTCGPQHILISTLCLADPALLTLPSTSAGVAGRRVDPPPECLRNTPPACIILP